MAQGANRNGAGAPNRGSIVNLATPLGPDATIGILGGGQLGRMLALAAARLGLKCHVYAPDPQSPAFDVVRRVTIAEYNDENALDGFARDVDVVTYEFENVPAFAATFLSARVPVLPNASVLARTQDRLHEKRFVEQLGISTAPYAAIENLDDLHKAVETIGRPAILKTRRFGYDGKGQVMIRNGVDLAQAWTSIGEQPSILETSIAFACEVSVIVARAHDGQIACFDVTENEHQDHILKLSRVPAKILDQTAAEARRIAERLADAFGYVGVMAVEMFVVREGGRETILVNEIAPRVHNSGHWTLDACAVSQFEQHIRAVAGWPLAEPIRHAAAEMTNLIGPEIAEAANWLKESGVAVHLYGKAGIRPGRKMGHVTRIITKG